MSDKCESKTQLELLKEQIATLEMGLKEKEELLEVSQRRYDIVMEFSQVITFDYNIKARKILTQPEDFETYGMLGVVENGVEEIINSGIIAERSKDDMRELYRRIDMGESSASGIIYANDLKGNERTLEFKIVNIFDEHGKPTYAVGVRKDITEAVGFRKEQEYSELLMSGFTFIYEANLTQDRITRYDLSWAQEIELDGIKTLSGLLELMCTQHIYPEDAELFYVKQSKQSLLSAFQSGERVVSFEYRKGKEHQKYLWYEVKINLVSDEITHDVNMRVYCLNIDNRKKNEIRAARERKKYELALSKSTLAYEVNLTSGNINSGNGAGNEKFKVRDNKKSLYRILAVLLKGVHPYDRATVSDLLTPASLLKAYGDGKTQMACEYRQINGHGKYNWHRCSLQLIEDLQTGDTLCYVYIEDIHEEKERELELIYKAQHDLMTGFYNRNTVEEKINEILFSEEGKRGIHIFFIIDLDCFKQVNDNFGHAFGDAVLSQTSGKINDLFRSGDILGRIGGDEFVVFMKNVQSEAIAFLKAQEICDCVAETYVQDEAKHKFSASVGIAIYGKHGKCYNELYTHSDTALYDAKEHGRNRFSMYQEGMNFNQTTVNGIDKRRIVETQTFESNISEYLFRILYESQDKNVAINTALALIGKHYNVSRAYVFENSEDENFAVNTFEWCNQGISPQRNEHLKIPYDEIGDYKKNFKEEGIFYMEDPTMLPLPVKDILNQKKVKSMVQFSILNNGEFAGFIGFDECDCNRMPGNKELNDYRNFSNILGVFITEMRALEKLERTKNTAMSVVNALDSYAYVCDPSSYEILFANVKALELAPLIEVGDICYKAFFNYDSPCRNCAIHKLEESGGEKYTRLTYKESEKLWFKISSSWLNWMEGQKSCLVDVMDITELKK